MTRTRVTTASHDPNHLTGLRVALYCRVSSDRFGTEKSVNDQETTGHDWIDTQGAVLAGVYRDANRSASEYARREREEYLRLLHDIQAGKVDVLWVWELSRAARRMSVLAKLIEDCKRAGVLFVVKDQVHDLSRSSSVLILSILGAIGQDESAKIRERVLRGQHFSALAGKPHGLVLFGYRRIYDPVTRQLVKQEKDPATAPLVQEIFERVAAGESINAVRRDLNARGIPNPGTRSRRKKPTSSLWSSRTVRNITLNRAYIGQRVHQGEVVPEIEAMWPPLVTAELFWAVQRVLFDPDRAMKRPDRARHLLSYQVKCAVCGGAMGATRNKPRRGTYEPVVVYSCSERRCAAIRASILDRYVQGRLLLWLADPEVYAELTRIDNSEAAAQAQADADQAQIELGEWRRLAEAGEVTAAGYASAEKGLLGRIKEAEKLVRASVLPPVLAGVIGPQAAQRWGILDLARKREIIRLVADIRVRPVGRGQVVHPADRVEWRWLIGPDQPAVDGQVAADGPRDPSSFYGRRGPKPGATAKPARCRQCGKDFITARSTPFCSGSCRATYYRQRRAKAADTA
jgi:DNA invertase Pin-like site-specific DNA recombinase